VTSAQTFTENQLRNNCKAYSRKSKILSKKMAVDAALWLDVCLNVVSSYVIYYIYLERYLRNTNDSVFYCYLTLFVLINLHFGLKQLGHYQAFGNRRHPNPYFALWLAIVFSFCIPLFALFLLKESVTLSRVWFISWMFCIYITLIITRHAWNWLFRICAEHGHLAHKVILIGSSDPLQRAKSFLFAPGKTANIQLLSVYDLENADIQSLRGEKIPEFQNILSDCWDGAVDEVIIALPADNPALLDRVIKTVKLLPTEVSLFFNDQGQNLKLYGVKHLGRMQAISIQRPPLSDWGRIAKIVSDYVIATLAIVVSFPLMLFIAIAIKLDSPGPVLFRQQRQGLNGKVIKVLKFRTMTVMEDGASVRQAQKNDSRVTWVGRILRRTSLDELPQFFNVLKGEMSVVGPRPHAIAHNTYYISLLENYANRYRVKPGITGWAQVNGFRGKISECNQMESRIKFDLEYIDNWSFFFDVYIMLITPFYGLFSRNAY
jgi:putative colanic acid biosynthesis UDP-glucose lipid carrier transferase